MRIAVQNIPGVNAVEDHPYRTRCCPRSNMARHHVAALRPGMRLAAVASAPAAAGAP
ncbi:hypothetical protein [Mycetohabitans sp. B8]|uniref:hypothetical protein n=1 Tax=Mycetohabitans sp. B8 TaxID=2841845 RepID=UPI001F46791C|nr:hypothetical protein [Mycetohabitans sp. B8]